jgi:hypothetical protein
VRFLLLENLGYGARVVAGPGALMRDFVAPSERLAVEIVQGGEGTSGEEARTDVLDGAFDAPFFVAPRRATRASGEMIVSGEFEEAGMKVDGIAAPLQDYAAEVVGREIARRPAPIVKGMDVTEEKILQRLIQEEFQPQSAAVGEGQDESGETAASTTDSDFAEMRPVDLGFLTGKEAEAEESFTMGRTDFSNHAAQLGDAARVAAGANHLEQSCGAQTGMLLQGLAEKIQVRSGEGVTGPARVSAKTIRFQGAPDGVGMAAEFGGNRADLPVLGVKQMADVYNLFVRDHGSPRERVHPSSSAAADLADDPAGGEFSPSERLRIDG